MSDKIIKVVYNDCSTEVDTSISNVDWDKVIKVEVSSTMDDMKWLQKSHTLKRLSMWRNIGNIKSLTYLKKYPNITFLWVGGNGLKSLNGIKLCSDLQTLYAHDNNLSSLDALQNSTSLLELYVRNNKIVSLNGIQKCNSLKALCVKYNKLRSLHYLENCRVLRTLNANENNLTSLNGLQNCKALIYLQLKNNDLISLDGIQNCTSLQLLDVSMNRLFSLNGLQNCTALQILYADDNNLSSLDGLQNCTTLRSLSISRNTHITFLPTFLIGFRNLESFTYDGLELELDPRMRRWINRIQNYGVVDIQVYNNSQNVHDSSIQQTVRDSMRRLLAQTNMPKQCLDTLRNDIVNDSVLTEKSKSQLLQYLESGEELIELCLIYGELLWTVWQTIHNTELGHNFNLETQTEIKRVLNQELEDGDCMCFTGRMTRLVNCLNGFCPLVEVKILDSSQIGNIVLLIKQQLEMSDEGYNVDTHKQQFKKEMLDRGESIQVINEWLEYIE